MTTAIAILQDAFEQIGEYAPGETISDADAQRGLIVLNDMLGQWSNENLACWAFLQQSVTLINNQGQYSIGPDVLADVNGARPLSLVQVYLQDGNGNRYNVRINTQYDFNLLCNGQVTSQVPSDCFYDPQVPLGLLNFWPVPVTPLYAAHWTSSLQLTAFPNLYDEIDFPLGYVTALKSNVAVRLAKYFGHKVPDDVRLEAMETRGAIKRKNQISQVSYFDPAIVAGAGAGFNILSGTWNGRGP